MRSMSGARGKSVRYRRRGGRRRTSRKDKSSNTDLEKFESFPARFGRRVFRGKLANAVHAGD